MSWCKVIWSLVYKYNILMSHVKKLSKLDMCLFVDFNKSMHPYSSVIILG